MERKRPRERLALKGSKRLGQCGSSERQAVHLCCKFAVCWSQPFKEGDAEGKGLGGGEDRGSRQRGPVRGPQTPLCKSCFHCPPWMMAAFPARGPRAGMEGLDPRLPDSLDTPSPHSVPSGTVFMESAAADGTGVLMSAMSE